MAVEIELKLSLAPEHLNRIKDHPLLKSLSVSRAVTQPLYSVYYDTPDLVLRNHAMALRLRRVGSQWIQTLKGGGGVEAGLHRRNEWETPVSGEAIDLDALEAIGGTLPPGAAKRLGPVFVTDFSRSARMLKFEGAEIEFAIDSGEIRAGSKTRPISELELELKSGEPRQLFGLALALADIVPLQVEDTSKAEYGYRLFSGEQAAPREAKIPRLDQARGIASALQAMMAACLAHVQANASGAIGEEGGEYLQQVWTGLRRLGTALEMALRFGADAELHALRDGVAHLSAVIGRAREWDAFMTQTVAPMVAAMPDAAGLRALWEACEARRDQSRAGAVMTLASPEYQRLVLRLGAWMNGDYWTTAGTQPGLKDFARGILEKRHAEVLALGSGLADGAAPSNALWVATGKLLDSVEWFASLHAPQDASRFIATLAELHKILGAVNDIGVAHRLLDELRGQVPPDALGIAREAVARDHARSLDDLGSAWRRFERQHVFWN